MEEIIDHTMLDGVHVRLYKEGDKACLCIRNGRVCKLAFDLPADTTICDAQWWLTWAMRVLVEAVADST